MEEMMTTTTMMIRRSGNPRKDSVSDDPITTSSFPTWKLYENPFFISAIKQSPQHKELRGDEQIHRLHLPISTSKIAASFWDLTFLRPLMESDNQLDVSRAEIEELKVELEYERKARRKVEAATKRMAKQLSEERKRKEALERACEDLAKEVSADKEVIKMMKKEMDDERKMIRVAEVLREERVQMKLAEARILMEEKLLQLEANGGKIELKAASGDCNADADSSAMAELKSCGSAVSVCSRRESAGGGGIVHCLSMSRRGSPEPGNPHVRRGVRGFVEFPKMLRAMGSTSGGHLGEKMECQKSQLRILIKQKSPVRSNNLIMS